jgi:hypothetical protein
MFGPHRKRSDRRLESACDGKHKDGQFSPQPVAGHALYIVEGRPVNRHIISTKGLHHAEKQDAHLHALRMVADIASSQLRSKLAKAAGTIPTVTSSGISISDDRSPTAFLLIYGHAVCPPYIVTATITISCPVDNSADGTSLAATPVCADIRTCGGNSEEFEVPVEFFADTRTLSIRNDRFQAAFKKARARLSEHQLEVGADFPG